MTRGGTGNLLGVGGTRANLSRSTLRGGGRGGRGRGGGADPMAEKRELLRKLKEARERGAGPEEDGTRPEEPRENRSGT
ncbi:DUF6243 family protein [Streptomyces sp. NPDC047108]|uniref:DUF6243 family protein n=1 Tax=Streptomyces sp. NPDC047108 TaxID=3155025 RepID=UPI0033D6F3DA